MTGPGGPRWVVFDPAARDELVKAVAYYDAERATLGDEFLLEVKRAIGRIRGFPDAWPIMSRRSRRCRLTRFPYGLVYQVTGQAIRILAVAHLHRRPRFWRERER